MGAANKKIKGIGVVEGDGIDLMLSKYRKRIENEN